MKEKDLGQKVKRKILVEFEIPREFWDYTEEDFKMKFKTLSHFLTEEFPFSAEFLNSAKPITNSNSKTYDTIP